MLAKAMRTRRARAASHATRMSDREDFTSYVLFASLACAGLVACGDAARTSLPASSASFAGRIEGRDGQTLLLVASVVQPVGADRASVRLHPGTRVLHAAGVAASADDLRVGQDVRAWFDGPVMESYPVQATAGTIIIDTQP